MRKKKISDSDFLYSTARIRALENGICTGDKFAQMAEAKAFDDLQRLLEEAGLPGDQEPFEAIDSRVQEAFSLVRELSGSDVFDVFRYPYDAHNLKSLLKAELRGQDMAGLVIDLGTLPANRLYAAQQDHDFSAFPPHMAQAAGPALEAYAKTKDPQRMDTMIDQACFADMLSKADEYDFPFLNELIRHKIDLTNLLTLLRLLRTQKAHAQVSHINEAFVRAHMIEGGTLAAGSLAALFSAGEEAFFSFLAAGNFQELAALGAQCSIAAFERAADDAYMRYIRDHTKYIAYGAGVLCAFIAAKETEAKNFRILVASVRGKIPPAEIKERLRLSYV